MGKYDDSRKHEIGKIGVWRKTSQKGTVYSQGEVKAGKYGDEFLDALEEALKHRHCEDFFIQITAFKNENKTNDKAPDANVILTAYYDEGMTDGPGAPAGPDMADDDLPF